MANQTFFRKKSPADGLRTGKNTDSQTNNRAILPNHQDKILKI
jgi:hypothetical protein